MRKKKFSKECFYRRLEAQNKKAVSKSETDWDVMQSGYPDCQIYPDFRSNMEVDLIRKPLYSKRRGRGGFTGAVRLDDCIHPLLPGEVLIDKSELEKLRANEPFFNVQNSQKKELTITINVPRQPTTYTREEEQALTDAYRSFFGDNKQPEPKPEFVPPPPLKKIEATEPNNDSGLFGQCLLHMAAIVACALLLCGILQKLSH